LVEVTPRTTRQARGDDRSAADRTGSTWWSPTRIDSDQAAYRTGHRTGNMLLTGFVAWVFGPTFTDMCRATAYFHAVS